MLVFIKQAGRGPGTELGAAGEELDPHPQSIRHLLRTYGISSLMSTCRKTTSRNTARTRNKSATWKDLWAVPA